MPEFLDAADRQSPAAQHALEPAQHVAPVERTAEYRLRLIKSAREAPAGTDPTTGWWGQIQTITVGPSLRIMPSGEILLHWPRESAAYGCDVVCHRCTCRLWRWRWRSGSGVTASPDSGSTGCDADGSILHAASRDPSRKRRRHLDPDLDSLAHADAHAGALPDTDVAAVTRAVTDAHAVTHTVIDAISHAVTHAVTHHSVRARHHGGAANAPSRDCALFAEVLGMPWTPRLAQSHSHGRGRAGVGRPARRAASSE